MSFTFDIPLDAEFLLFFIGGLFVVFMFLWMIIDYARRRVEYNCMGVKLPTQGRKAPPLPLHNPNL